jgi:hypothetical protein
MNKTERQLEEYREWTEQHQRADEIIVDDRGFEVAAIYYSPLSRQKPKRPKIEDLLQHLGKVVCQCGEEYDRDVAGHVADRYGMRYVYYLISNGPDSASYEICPKCGRKLIESTK